MNDSELQEPKWLLQLKVGDGIPGDTPTPKISITPMMNKNVFCKEREKMWYILCLLMFYFISGLLRTVWWRRGSPRMKSEETRRDVK